MSELKVVDLIQPLYSPQQIGRGVAKVVSFWVDLGEQNAMLFHAMIRAQRAVLSCWDKRCF